MVVEGFPIKWEREREIMRERERERGSEGGGGCIKDFRRGFR